MQFLAINEPFFCILDISRHTQTHLKTSKQKITEKLKFNNLQPSNIMQNKSKIKPKQTKIDLFWKQATWPRIFFQILDLSLLSTQCHLTSCKKSEKSNEWIFRYIDFSSWSVNYWSVFCTYFEEKYLRNQKFPDNGFL